MKTTRLSRPSPVLSFPAPPPSRAQVKERGPDARVPRQGRLSAPVLTRVVSESSPSGITIVSLVITSELNVFNYFLLAFLFSHISFFLYPSSLRFMREETPFPRLL